MNYTFFITALILLPLIAAAQTDSLNRNEHVESRIILIEDTTDSINVFKTKKSVQELKSIINSRINELKLHPPTLESLPVTENIYTFTKEELNSGLSHQELIAFRNNKEKLKQILADTYENRKGPEFLHGILEKLDKAKYIAAILIGILSMR